LTQTATAGPELVGLQIADPAQRWAALGFTVDGDLLALGGVVVRFIGGGQGITGWSVRAIAPVETVDGLATTRACGPAGAFAGGEPHPNGAVGIDHVVVVTPDFDRTAAALEAAGMPLRRIRVVGGDPRDDPGAFRQGFRRLGPAILELVEAKGAPAGPAAFWGLVVIVEDLGALAERLGSHLSPSRPAVQPGRRIASLRASAGLSPRVAFMDPEPSPAA
jgi:hypothetical protein